MARKISLTQDKYALVDDEDFEYLNQWKWHVNIRGERKRAVRTLRKNGKKFLIYMHREIMGLLPGDKRQIDHINHIELDNRHCNLRICTSSQNQANQKSRRETSKFKGVHRHSQRNLWVAKIKQEYLGCFKSEIDAALVYDIAAKNLFGGFANLNFKENQT
jgi:hypothetical protein